MSKSATLAPILRGHKIQLGIILFLVALSSSVFADGFDYHLQSAVRSKPLGGGLVAHGGYGFILWGERKNRDFRYGYLRPAFTLRTSGLVTQGEAKISFFPISFLGFSAGYQRSSRNTDFDTVDCTVFDCRGTLDSEFWDGSLKLGFQNWFGAFLIHEDALIPQRKGVPFAEEGSALGGSSDRDTLTTLVEVLGCFFGDAGEWRGGFYSSQQRMKNSEMSNRLNSVFIGKVVGPWTATVGIGVYESSFTKQVGTLYGSLKWEGLPSIELN